MDQCKNPLHDDHSLATGAKLTDYPRLLIDVSSLARWTGPPVGMIRVQQEIRRHLPPNAIPVFFDTIDCSFRILKAPWDALVLGDKGCIDLGDRTRRAGWRAMAPSRYAMFLTLEKRRLTLANPLAAKGAAWLQDRLLALRRHNLVIHDAERNRLARVPSGMVLGAQIIPGPGDLLLMAGNGWYHAPADMLAALKRRLGFQLAVICYDIIPLQRPDWFPDDDAATFKNYWDAMFPLVDRLIVNSQAVSADVTAYCAAIGLSPPPIRCVPLGATPPEPALPTLTQLPASLEAERYALFVSTIEPRKGHAMLLRAWRMVLEMHGTQGFHLVFVGRPGWGVEPVLAALQEMQGRNRVLHVPNATDTTLRALYRHAAFCLYPSEYEGFGLPVVEAFNHGKAVIVSTGGALPELTTGLAPGLDPHDAPAWADMIGAWIIEPALRRAAETRVRENFVPRGWGDAAPALIDAARRVESSRNSVAIPRRNANASGA